MRDMTLSHVRLTGSQVVGGPEFSSVTLWWKWRRTPTAGARQQCMVISLLLWSGLCLRRSGPWPRTSSLSQTTIPLGWRPNSPVNQDCLSNRVPPVPPVERSSRREGDWREGRAVCGAGNTMKEWLTGFSKTRKQQRECESEDGEMSYMFSFWEKLMGNDTWSHSTQQSTTLKKLKVNFSVWYLTCNWCFLGWRIRKSENN